MAKSLEDIYKSMDAQANAYDGVDNTSALEKYAYSALDDAPPPQQAPQDVNKPEPILGQDLEVVDGDTVKFGGVTYRLGGYDTAETDHGEGGNAKAQRIQDEHGISMEDQFATGDIATAKLQMMVNKGQLTAKDLVSSSSGLDAYGRVVTNVGHVADAMINSGNAAPTNKYDDKRQRAFRTYALKQKSKGKDSELPASVRLLDSMRKDSASGQDQHVDEYLGNLGKKAVGSFARTASSFGDWVLDVTAGTVKKNAGRVVNALGGDVDWDGNIELLDDAAQQGTWDKTLGIDRRDDSYAKDEIMFDYHQGNYATALAKSALMAPDTLIDSSGDIAITMVPFAGLAFRTAQVAKSGGTVITALQKGLEFAAKSDKATIFTSGAVVAGLVRGNEYLAERQKNNGGRENSPQEVLGAAAIGLLSAASERLAFKGVASNAANAFTTAEIRGLASITPPAALTALAKGVGGTAASAFGEGVQEWGQTLGEVFAKQYHTDKQMNADGTYKTATEVYESNKEEIILATLLGAGAGGGMHAGGSGIGLTAQGSINAYNILSRRAASRQFLNDFSNLSEADRTVLSEAIVTEQATLDKLEQMPANVRAEVSGAIVTDPDTNVQTIDMSKIKSPEAISALFNGLVQEIHDVRDDKVLESSFNAISSYYNKRIKDVLTNTEVDRAAALAEIQVEITKFTHKKDISPLIEKAGRYLDDVNNGKKTGPEALTEVIEHLDNNMSEIFSSKDTVKALAYHSLFNPTNSDLTHPTAGKDAAKASETVIKEYEVRAAAHRANLTRISEMYDTSVDDNPSRIVKETSTKLKKRAESLEKEANRLGVNHRKYRAMKAKARHINKVLKSRDRVMSRFGINQHFGTAETTSAEAMANANETVEKGMSLIRRVLDASRTADVSDLARGEANLDPEALALLKSPADINNLAATILSGNVKLTNEEKADLREFLRKIKSDITLPVATDKILEALSDFIYNTSDEAILNEMKTTEPSQSFEDLSGTYDNVSITEVEYTIQDANAFAEKLGIQDLLC